MTTHDADNTHDDVGPRPLTEDELSELLRRIEAGEHIDMIMADIDNRHEHKIKVACSRAGCAWAAALLVGVLLGLSTMLNDFTEAVGLY